MHTFQDSSKKTSINALLNPQDTSFYSGHSANGPSYEQQARGRAYSLSPANWGQSNLPSPRSVDQAQASHSARAGNNEPSRRHLGSADHASSSDGPTTLQWQTAQSYNPSPVYPDTRPTMNADVHTPTRSNPMGTTNGSRMAREQDSSFQGASYANAQPPTRSGSMSSTADPKSNGQGSSYYRDAGTATPNPQSQSSSLDTMAGSRLTGPQDTSYYRDAETPTMIWQTTERASIRMAVRQSMPPPEPPQPFQNVPWSITSGQPAPQAGPSSRSADRVPKRPLAEGDAPSPKAKRPAKTKARTGSDNVPAPSKRGFNAKKRNEAAQIAAQHAQPSLSTAATTIFNPIGPAVTLTPEFQFARCMSNRYKNQDFPRCVSCTRRWAGDTCRFQGIRYLLRDENKNLVGFSFGDKAQAPDLQFCKEWNTPLRKDHIQRTKKVIANALLPTMKHELRQFDHEQLIKRRRECEVRVTCDTCMTSIFSSSWMCRMCGREACSDCFALVRELTQELPGATDQQRAEQKRRRDKHAHSNPFFLSCTKRIEHDVTKFSPMSRFEKAELSQAIEEMERLTMEESHADPTSSVASGANPQFIQPPVSTTASCAKDAADPTTPTVVPPAVATIDSNQTYTGVYLRNQWKASFLPPEVSPTGQAPAQYVPPNLNEAAASVPTVEPYRFTDEELTNVESTKFAEIWKHGEPLVVSNILSKFKIDWSPQYFISEFGDRDCLITECEQDLNKRTTVMEFFSSFGKYDGRTEVWKLKDWPPSSDFKSAFPKLYEDFSNAVPVPDYVRRDGVLNIASHFPSNVIAPDLGPKMYNAYAAKQGLGSKGSTRLHMDMADALNVMLYAADCPDGTDGCAVWDIYRAVDSDKLRSFLKEHYSLQINYDPIHGQQYYLDDDHRMKLYQKYGVKSYRIYQKPGEAVFIPAGCAHQVFNMADSIKIAIDFVSPENINRCAQLTREFREQNKSKVWKEDVLQLKTMMWFAWKSCAKREEDYMATSAAS